jgi:ABC-type Fe3+ transport system substrate-binding protein
MAPGPTLRALGLLFTLAFLVGCGGRAEPTVRLTLISPHRDEIREEIGLAFPDWFRARAEARLAAARDALQGWLADPTPARLAAARHALEVFTADWRAEDLGPLSAVLAEQWQPHPNPAAGAALVRALDDWQTQIPGVELVWQDVGGGTSQITRYVTASFQDRSQGIGIDLLFGGGTDVYLRFADQGLLQKVEIPAALRDRIPAQLNGVPLYDPQGRWYGPMLSSFGILFNREVLRRIGQPEPRRWADLGQPGLCGWVSAGDPRMTGSVHMVYEIILQDKGWEKGFPLLLRLGANAHGFIRDSGTLTRTVSNGEVAAAGNLDANALTAVGRDPERVGFALPSGETILNPDAIAVLRGAPQPGLARAFVEFTLSDAGQLLFLLRPGEPGGPRRFPLCRLSVVEALYQRYPPERRSVGAANPFAVGNTITYKSTVGITRWDALNDLFGAVIVDAHPELSAAWRAVLDSRLPAADRERLELELFAPPCSLEELNAHARSIVADGPRARTLTINRWGEEARRRYRDIRQRAR